MAGAPGTRLQLCGRLTAEIAGVHVEDRLRGRQGRQLLAYLIVNRSRPVPRDELIDALWPHEPPPRPGAALSTLLSSLRQVVGPEHLAGRSEVQLTLPPDAWVDIEAAAEGISRAEAAMARGEWQVARAPAQVAVSIAERGFLPGHDAPWIDVRRRDVDDLLLDGLESLAVIGVRIGGSELAVAERAARRLVELAPLRESGHVVLMEVQEARGNPAEGLRLYEELRRQLREELGAAPGVAARDVHLRLLRSSEETPVPAAEGEDDADHTERTRGKARWPLSPLLDAPERVRFVGRQRDLGRLALVLDRARELPRQLGLVAGEPGIGKTRLLARFGCQAQEGGARVLYGRVDQAGLVPYGPFAEALRHHAAHAGPEALARATALGGGELLALLPELAPVAASGDQPAASPDPALARYRLFDSISALLVDAAREGPVVLLVDDLHWADEPTLLLLKHVLRAGDQRRLLVVGTYRDAELHRAPALWEALTDLQRDVPVERLHLRGLARPDVATLARETTGREAPESLVESIHEETEGNPFFVLELARHLAESGGVEPEGPRELSLTERVGLPESVREVILRRLSSLSEPAQRGLRVASALGREFDLDVLERVEGLAGEEVAAGIEEAVGAGVLNEVPDRPERLSFAHALIQATLYGELAATRRIRLHERIGQALEALGAEGRGVPTAEVASHLLAALPRGEPERAVDAAVRAAAEATNQLAYEDAEAHLARALRALERHRPGDTLRRSTVLLDLGHAQRRSGRMPEARETFLRAIEAARELGDSELLASAVLGYGGGWFESAFLDETMVALLEEALAGLRKDDTALRLELLSRLAKALYYSEDERDEARRVALSAEAIGMAERLGDRRSLLVALEGRHFALTSPENLDERLTTARRIIELAGEVGDRERELLGRYFRIGDLVEADEMAEAAEQLDEYGRLAEESRLPLHRWYHARFRAMQALLAGRLEEAAAAAQVAFELGHPVEPRTATMHFGAQMWLLHYLQGQLSGLEEAVRGFVAEYPRVAAWRMGLALVLLEQGRTEEARDVFREFTESRFEKIPRDAIWGVTAGLAADLVAAGLGDAADARALYDLMRPFADRNAVTGEVIFCSGPVALYVGQLALVMGDLDEAVGQLEEALERSRRMGARPFEARAAEGLAEALRSRAGSADEQRARAIAATGDMGVLR